MRTLVERLHLVAGLIPTKQNILTFDVSAIPSLLDIAAHCNIELSDAPLFDLDSLYMTIEDFAESAKRDKLTVVGLWFDKDEAD